MGFDKTYKDCYVQILGEDGLPVGSGICIDRKHVITCAHVVNAACKEDLHSIENPKKELSICFPQNEQLANYILKVDIAAWCWDHPDIQAKSDIGVPNDLLMQYDMAVLFIKETGIDLAQMFNDDPCFLIGSFSGYEFKTLVYKVDENSTLDSDIDGCFGFDNKISGITIMKPSPNVRELFFSPGSSGSPVFTKICFEDGDQTGIAGFVDFLSKDEGFAQEARMISSNKIRNLLSQFCCDIRLNEFNIDEKRDRAIILKLKSSVLSGSGYTKEIFCDRKEQIDSIKEKLKNKQKIFFIYGNEKQMLELFIFRYMHDFIASKKSMSIPFSFSMPRGKKEEFWLKDFLDNIYGVFSDFDVDIPEPENYNIEKLCKQRSFIRETEYVLNFKIENGDFCPEQKPFYKWFFKYFLGPIIKEGALRNIHIFISFYHRPGIDISESKQILLDIFKEVDLVVFNETDLVILNDIGLPLFKNIPRKVLEDWLGIAEGNNVFVKNKIKDKYELKDEYDMEEIVTVYKKAISEIDKF